MARFLAIFVVASFVPIGAGAATALTVQKCSGTNTCSCSGSGICLSWTGAATPFDGTAATDAAFYNPSIQFASLSGTSYTYPGAGTNGRDLEFFDVTDQTGNESNRGGDPNGLLPPSPPAISSISAGLYVGGTGTIAGTGFSEVAGDNDICFESGPCIHPTTATSSQLTFTVPVGATSGNVSVSVATLSSDVSNASLVLEDTAFSSLTFRSLGFARSTGDYWSAVLDSGTNRVYQHHYDPGQAKWTRTAREGAFTLTHYCSTKTDRNKYLFCAQATTTLGSAGTRRILTDPASNMVACINLAGCGTLDNCRAIGVAPDPNPQAVAGRDVVYFAFNNTSTGGTIIEKVAADCSTVLDTNYGGKSNWVWNSIVGMSVDPATGDLYVAEVSSITKVAPDETVSTFKSGFGSIFGLDVFHEPGSSFGEVVVADNGTGQVSTVPLDNPTVAPTTLASVTTPRGVCFSASTFSNASMLPSDQALTIAHNAGGQISMRREPYLALSASVSPAYVWISAPDVRDKGPAQGTVRPSFGAPAGAYSTFKVMAHWTDEKPRQICASLGDAPTLAPYETVGTGSGCTKPYRDPVTGAINGVCDNREPFDTATGQGVGTSATSNSLIDCQSCGGAASPCVFQFRISQQFAGDDYRLYLQVPSTSWTMKAATSVAWKRAYIEQDDMCKTGALLAQSFDGAPCTPWAPGDPLCESVPNPAQLKCNELRVFGWHNLQAGQTVRVFDAATTYETSTVEAIYNSSSDLGDGTHVICLRNVLGQGVNLSGQFAASASATPPVPDFSVGKSAGACATASDVYRANTSQLNRRLKTGTLDDGFISTYLKKEGVGRLPYLPTSYFDSSTDIDQGRLHQIWFSHKRALAPPNDDLNSPQNYFHVIGASNSTANQGVTLVASDYSYIFVDGTEAGCGDATCRTNGNISTTGHEIAHEYVVNGNAPCIKRHDFATPSYDAWCGAVGGACANPILGNTRCLMSGATDPTQFDHDKDDLNRLECEDLGLPATQCPNQDCGPGLRDQTDPQ